MNNTDPCYELYNFARPSIRIRSYHTYNVLQLPERDQQHLTPARE